MKSLRACLSVGSRVIAVLTLAGGALALDVTPSQAATPLPVKTASGTNHDTPDPGALLFSGNFYTFSTGTGLQESTSAIAAGPWSTPANTLDMSTIPQGSDASPLPVKRSTGKNYDTPDPGVALVGSTFYAFSTGGGLHESSASLAAGPWSTPASMLSGALPSWADHSKGIWAPDMIQLASDKFVVYFSAALNGTAGHKAGHDLSPASGARCIGTAEGTKPGGKFTADAKPLVCFNQFHPADNMDGDPGQRERGEGVIDASPVFVTRGGQRQLFLVYKTQGDPGAGQHATIRMVRLDAANGTSVVGESHQLLSSGLGSFADTIEAPSLVQHGSWFILFVAHGNFGNCGYSTQWFKSQHIWAWSDNGGSTLLSSSSTSGLCGPGSADVTTSRIASQYRIFFHAWVKESSKGVISTTPLPPNVAPHENKNAARVMYAAVLTFAKDGFTPLVGAFQGQ